jgi:SAM-dependent methyltransferase
VSGRAEPFYGADVAHVHDTGHGDFARDAAPGVLARIRSAGFARGLVVDLGCGSGIWARALLDAGLDVLGIDLSEDLLAIARRRAPQARFVVGSLLDVTLPPCVAVTALSEVVNYAADPRLGRAALAALARRVHAALVPGGLLLFDALGPAHEPPARRRWREGADWVVLSELTDGPGPRRRSRRVVVFRRDADTGAWRRTDETHRLWMADPDEVRAELAAAGFAEVEALDGWGGARLAAGHVAYAATRAVD